MYGCQIHWCIFGHKFFSFFFSLWHVFKGDTVCVFRLQKYEHLAFYLETLLIEIFQTLHTHNLPWGPQFYTPAPVLAQISGHTCSCKMKLILVFSWQLFLRCCLRKAFEVPHLFNLHIHLFWLWWHWLIVKITGFEERKLHFSHLGILGVSQYVIVN